MCKVASLACGNLQSTRPMKDNKYVPYILGPILLLIWGLIFYKIYQAVYGGVDDFEVPSYGALPVFEQVQKDSSYALLLDYKDPFLGQRFSYKNNTPAKPTINRSISTRASNTRRKTVSPTPTVVAIPFPTVVYQGFQIMNRDTVALLKVNKRFYPIAHRGDVFDGVQVQGIYADSVQVRFEGRMQTILKGQ